MALAGPVPPWLQISPETYTGAMAAGAKLGLTARSQDLTQERAADRLQLAYEQLQAKEEMAAQNLQSKMQLAHSQLDYKTQLAESQLDMRGQIAAAQQNSRDVGLALRQQQIDKGPASLQLVDEIGRADMDVAEATKQGAPPEVMARLKDRAQLLREQGKTPETVIGWDPVTGHPTVRIGKGVGSTGGATTAMQTQAQERLVKYQNSMELLARLDNILKPSDIGARGVVGEYIIDRGLQQLAEMAGMNVASEGRIDSRKLIIALRESLMRDMSSDTSRFTLQDREEVSKALPSSGVFESYENAKRGLDLARNILVSKSRNYAKSVNQPPPLWTLSAEEIIAMYHGNALDRATALDALQRFH